MVVRERQGAGGLGGGEGRCGRGGCEEGVVAAPREGLHDIGDAWDAGHSGFDFLDFRFGCGRQIRLGHRDLLIVEVVDDVCGP